MRPVVILGAGGQVGRRFTAAMSDRDCHAYARADVDITSEAALRSVIADNALVVNCAAYTAVDKAEAEVESAYNINGIAPGLMARICHERGAALIHISTDYVFGDAPGKARPWREDDPISPRCVYARTKADGEKAVRDALDRHIILRTSWVFDSEGQNFVRTMLRLGAGRSEIDVVSDQHGAPTAACDIASAMRAIVNAIEDPAFDRWGTYHFTGSPATTWYEFAKAILDGRSNARVNPISTSQYPTAATRPAYAVLDCSRIAGNFGIDQPDWRAALARVLSEMRL